MRGVCDEIFVEIVDAVCYVLLLHLVLVVKERSQQTIVQLRSLTPTHSQVYSGHLFYHSKESETRLFKPDGSYSPRSAGNVRGWE